MNETVLVRSSDASGVFGVFFVLLGAGVILDGDWLWRGTASIALGACLLLASRRTHREGTES